MCLPDPGVMKLATRTVVGLVALVVAVAGCAAGQTKARAVVTEAARVTATTLPVVAAGTPTQTTVATPTTVTTVATTTTTTTSVPVPPPDPDAELGEFDELDDLLDELDDLLAGL